MSHRLCFRDINPYILRLDLRTYSVLRLSVKERMLRKMKKIMDKKTYSPQDTNLAILLLDSSKWLFLYTMWHKVLLSCVAYKKRWFWKWLLQIKDKPFANSAQFCKQDMQWGVKYYFDRQKMQPLTCRQTRIIPPYNIKN